MAFISFHHWDRSHFLISEFFLITFEFNILYIIIRFVIFNKILEYIKVYYDIKKNVSKCIKLCYNKNKLFFLKGGGKVNIFKDINNNPKNFEEAQKNIKTLNKNVVKKQNKDKQREVKRW